MRKFWIAFLLPAFVATSALAEAPQTVGDYSNALNDVARRLELQLADRQRAGEAAAAQRLALTAAMIRRGSAEFRGAEQGSLTYDLDSLPAPIKAKVVAALACAQEAEAHAAGEPGFIDKAQATFNALIEALPIVTPHPTLYGLLSNDLTEPAGRLGADLVIYGDRLIDPVYPSAPRIAYAGAELPSDAVHVRDDRIEITLPEATKAAMNYAPPPCEKRRSFGLRVHSVYALRHGFWPFYWRTQVDSIEDVFALASPVLYQAKISGVVDAAATEAATVPFRRLSEFVVADCDQTKSVEVSLAAPEGASDVDCQSEWVNASGGTANAGRCESRNGAIAASGSLTGPAKVCSPDKLCACPKLAQGFLQITGSYRVARSASGYKPLPALPLLFFPQGGRAEQTFGAERLRQLNIDVSRRDCPKVTDTMSIDLGGEAGASGVAVSPSTMFHAIFEDGRLSVGSADAFAP